MRAGGQRLPALTVLTPPFKEIEWWGRHHTKAFLAFYPAGVRVVVYTTNGIGE